MLSNSRLSFWSAAGLKKVEVDPTHDSSPVMFLEQILF